MSRIDESIGPFAQGPHGSIDEGGSLGLGSDGWEVILRTAKDGHRAELLITREGRPVSVRRLEVEGEGIRVSLDDLEVRGSDGV